jgi:hypothetical protein
MKYNRLILGIILLLLLFSLMLYNSFNHNNHDPDLQYILDHFERFNMTKVTLTGEVTNIDKTNNTLLLHVEQFPKSIILLSTADNASTIHQGDIVEVYGTLTSKTHMTVENMLVSARWNYDLIFIRSLPAIPFALYLFFRTYRFNSDTRRFERRQKHA